jgi:hypothetical protein
VEKKVIFLLSFYHLIFLSPCYDKIDSDDENLNNKNNCPNMYDDIPFYDYNKEEMGGVHADRIMPQRYSMESDKDTAPLEKDFEGEEEKNESNVEQAAVIRLEDEKKAECVRFEEEKPDVVRLEKEKADLARLEKEEEKDSEGEEEKNESNVEERRKDGHQRDETDEVVNYLVMDTNGSHSNKNCNNSIQINDSTNCNDDFSNNEQKNNDNNGGSSSSGNACNKKEEKVVSSQYTAVDQSDLIAINKLSQNTAGDSLIDIKVPEDTVSVDTAVDENIVNKVNHNNSINGNDGVTAVDKNIDNNKVNHNNGNDSGTDIDEEIDEDYETATNGSRHACKPLNKTSKSCKIFSPCTSGYSTPAEDSGSGFKAISSGFKGASSKSSGDISMKIDSKSKGTQNISSGSDKECHRRNEDNENNGRDNDEDDSDVESEESANLLGMNDDDDSDGSDERQGKIKETNVFTEGFECRKQGHHEQERPDEKVFAEEINEDLRKEEDEDTEDEGDLPQGLPAFSAVDITNSGSSSSSNRKDNTVFEKSNDATKMAEGEADLSADSAVNIVKALEDRASLDTAVDENIDNKVNHNNMIAIKKLSQNTAADSLIDVKAPEDIVSVDTAVDENIDSKVHHNNINGNNSGIHTDLLAGSAVDVTNSGSSSSSIQNNVSTNCNDDFSNNEQKNNDNDGSSSGNACNIKEEKLVSSQYIAVDQSDHLPTSSVVDVTNSGSSSSSNSKDSTVFDRSNDARMAEDNARKKVKDDAVEAIRLEQAEVTRLEDERKAESGRFEKEKAEVVRLEKGKADLARLEEERKAESVRFEEERKAEVVRLGEEKAELTRLEKEEMARLEKEEEKAELARFEEEEEKAELARLEREEVARLEKEEERAELARFAEEKAEVARLKEENAELARLELEEEKKAELKAKRLKEEGNKSIRLEEERAAKEAVRLEQEVTAAKVLQLKQEAEAAAVKNMLLQPVVDLDDQEALAAEVLRFEKEKIAAADRGAELVRRCKENVRRIEERAANGTDKKIAGKRFRDYNDEDILAADRGAELVRRCKENVRLIEERAANNDIDKKVAGKHSRDDNEESNKVGKVNASHIGIPEPEQGLEKLLELIVEKAEKNGKEEELKGVQENHITVQESVVGTQNKYTTERIYDRSSEGSCSLGSINGKEEELKGVQENHITAEESVVGAENKNRDSEGSYSLGSIPQPLPMDFHTSNSSSSVKNTSTSSSSVNRAEESQFDGKFISLFN